MIEVEEKLSDLKVVKRNGKKSRFQWYENRFSYKKRL